MGFKNMVTLDLQTDRQRTQEFCSLPGPLLTLRAHSPSPLALQASAQQKLHDAVLIYIQVKDSTDGVKDPVAMEIEPGQGRGSLVMQLAEEAEVRVTQ